jgi:DNA-directed RNA polymerase subunit alpha
MKNFLLNNSFLKFETKVIKQSKNFAVLKLTNINNNMSGLFITIGNALRRILLNNLMGTAIVHFSIDEPVQDSIFLQSVKEDLFEISSNMKKVNLRSFKLKHCNAKIIVQGPAVVTAGDLIIPTNIVVTNPHQYLFTVVNNEKIKLSLKIEQGFGYKFYNEQYAPFDDSPASRFLDANFSPVMKANYKVILEESKVFNNKMVESLLLEIWTDGSISPIRAFFEANKILASIFISLIN